MSEPLIQQHMAWQWRREKDYLEVKKASHYHVKQGRSTTSSFLSPPASSLSTPTIILCFDTFILGLSRSKWVSTGIELKSPHVNFRVGTGSHVPCLVLRLADNPVLIQISFVRFLLVLFSLQNGEKFLWNTQVSAKDVRIWDHLWLPAFPRLVIAQISKHVLSIGVDSIYAEFASTRPKTILDQIPL